MRRLAVLLAAACALAAPSAAVAQYSPPPGTPPAICAGTAFVDLVGTAGPDRLAATNRATRVWGLGGDDVLAGSGTRVACLLGGKGNDVLGLNTGGGVALGGPGRDTLLGSALGDILDGGKDSDGITAYDGDDKITAQDKRPEMIDCGDGADIVKADRVDVLIDCESVDVTGPSARRLSTAPAKTSQTGMVRVRLTVPKAAGAGAYRMILVTANRGRACADGPVEITRFPDVGGRVRKGQKVKIGLRHPPFGWCRGTARVVLVRDPGQGFPAVPVARLSFNVS